MRLVDRGILQSFLDRWLSECSTTSVTDPVEVLESVVTTKGAGGYEYLWKSNSSPFRRPDFLATTMKCKFLKAQLDHDTTLRYDLLFRKISEFDASRPISELERIEGEIYRLKNDVYAKGDPAGLIEVTFDKPIGGPKPQIWFTSFQAGDVEDQIWQSRAKWHQRADLARDKLGLVHMGSSTGYPPSFMPELLATVVVSVASIPSSTKFARPTLMDAGKHSRFKGAFGDFRKKPNEWGRAVNLAKMLLLRPHRGGREVVVENFRPVGPVRVCVLGFTRVPRHDTLNIHDLDFSSSVLRSRRKLHLKGRFQKLWR